MTIGLLIITHNNIGADLVDTAIAMLGVCPLDSLSTALQHTFHFSNYTSYCHLS